MSMSCGLCLKVISDAASAVQTTANCKHYFHNTCVKVRCCLPSKTHAATKVKDCCPACVTDVSPILKEISEKLSKIDGVDKNVAKFGKKLDKFDETMKSVNDKVDKLISNYDMLQKNVKDLEARVSKIEETQPDGGNNLLEEARAIAKNIADGDLEARMLQMESRSLADELTITGLPELDGEKLPDVVVRLTQALKVPVTENEIVSVERLGRKSNRSHRSVCVKFNSLKHVDECIKSIKKAKVKVGTLMPGVSVQDADATLMPGAQVRDADATIYLHRRHPSSLYKLRLEVRKKYPAIHPKNIWISNTSVNVRYADNEPPVKLRPTVGVGPLQDLIE